MPKLVDYYAILAVPPDADLIGIENAYARISSELVAAMEHDETAAVALQRVNEAYAVLSNPETRRVYDQAFFAAEIAAEQRRIAAELRRQRIVQGLLAGVVVAIVVVQSAALAALNWERVAPVLRAIFGPIVPDIAG
ncbi:MAG: J domain-containing protein [Chloroflexota bacterium]|nr:J domain-containing protein [Dehalococcoidia bacterium]MDW8046196.1 J domain-containing protein [Chloroflexota bacterium]